MQQRFPRLPWHLKKQTPLFPNSWQSFFFLLEGKRLTPSLALPALLLAVTHSSSKSSSRLPEPRGWTDLLHQAEGGQAHTCMPGAEPA